MHVIPDSGASIVPLSRSVSKENHSLVLVKIEECPEKKVNQ